MSLLSPAASPVSMNETAASTIRTRDEGKAAEKGP